MFLDSLYAVGNDPIEKDMFKFKLALWTKRRLKPLSFKIFTVEDIR